MHASKPSFVHACALADLDGGGPLVVHTADRPVVLFRHGEKVFAVDNRCPHLGFPLNRGSLEDGMITCHWHHARFDARSGCTFDLWADDVPAYDVAIRDGQVHVRCQPRRDETGDHDLRRLHDGMRHNIGLVMAKAILALRSSGVNATTIVRHAALYGTAHRDDWASGMTILAAMANLLPHLREETAYLALYHGVRHVAADCAGQPPRQPRRALDSEEHDPATLERWLRYWTLVRHRDGAERTVLTAMARADTRPTVARMMLAAAGSRFYADTGHVFDFTNKACELASLIGDDHAPQLLPTVVGQLVRARGGEEINAWRHPIDLVPLVSQREPILRDHLASPVHASGIEQETAMDPLLGDDPEAAMDAVVNAARRGAALADLTRAAAHAAAVRIARFGTVNEHGDWIAALHSFTFCNALDAVACRHPDPDLAGSLLHATMSIYLNRFLNVPAARLPNADHLASLPKDGGSLLTGFLEVLDTRHNVDAAAAHVARYLELDLPMGDLIDAMAMAVVREDAEFHTYQMLEAAVRQYFRWSPAPQASVTLVAAARYIAAHSPTQRAQRQTARIAWRLHRGESVHD